MATPRTMPVGVRFDAASTFELEQSVSQSRSGNKIINIIQYSDPTWVASLVTQPLNPTEYRALQLWYNSLREGLRPVMFTHTGYKGPAAHAANLTPAQTNGTLSNITGGNTLTITGVSSALVLSQGDFLGLTSTGGIKGVAQVDSVSGNGTSRTVVVEPLVDSEFIGGSVSFTSIQLLMRPVSGSWAKNPSSIMAAPSFQLAEARI